MALRNIDLALLRTFMAVAETGRMTTAAQVVGRSQGAVSQQIKRLEVELGCALFKRGAAMRLTRSGERLLAKSHQLLRLNDETLSSVQRSDFAGEVRLGVAYDIVRSLLPRPLRVFRKLHPVVLLTLTSAASQDLLTKLSRSELDVAITTDRVAAADAQPLFRSRLVWAGARQGASHRGRPLSVALGDERCAFRSSAIEALSISGVEWRPVCQAGGLEAVFTTLEADYAIAPLLECAVPKTLVRLRDRRLPTLPEFHIAMRVAPGGVTSIVQSLLHALKSNLGSSS